MISKRVVGFISAGWASFALTHLTMSHPPIRSWIINRIKQEQGQKEAVSPATAEKKAVDTFLGIYSLVAFACLVPTTWIYLRNREASSVLRNPGAASRAVGTALNTMAIVAVGQSVATPSKAVTASKHQKDDEKEGSKPVHGILR